MFAENPEGPADVPLGIDRRIESMLNTVLSDTGSEVMFGVTGGGQDGSFACNKCQVVSLFGAIPLPILINTNSHNNNNNNHYALQLIQLMLPGSRPS